MTDRSHCPNDQYGNPQQYFSPVAPESYCAPLTVPEPSTLVLVVLALVVAIVVRKVRS